MNRLVLRCLGVVACTLAPALAAAQQAPSDTAAPLVLAHVTVVDVERGRLLPDQDVVVRGSRIASVGRSGRSRAPAGARTVDARGRYLIPGLWDMHVHSGGDREARTVFFPLYLASGVTGVRHMFGNAAVLRQRADVASGAQPGPRLVVGSPIVDGPNPMWPGSVRVSTAAEAARALDSLSRGGYDFVKSYQFLPREAYFGLLAAARKRGFPVSGHVPFSAGAGEASDSGQKSLEHLVGVSLACSSREDSLRAVLAAAAEAADTGFVAHAQLYTRNEVLPVSTFDAAKCEGLYRRLARNRTWTVPTLVVHRAFASLGDSAFRADPRLADMPAAYRMFWGFSRSDPAYRAAYEQHLRTVGAMHRAGVPILAGTDVLNPYIFPGSSLHDELELLARAGLAPLDALRTATLNPARYLGRADSLGTVAAGKLADLVLLDADPLADVRNTRRIRAVVAAGRYLDRAALDRLVAEAREAGKAPPSWP